MSDEHPPILLDFSDYGVIKMLLEDSGGEHADEILRILERARTHPAPDQQQVQQQTSTTDNLVVVEVDGIFYIHHSYMNDGFSLIRSDVKELILKCIPDHDAAISELAAAAERDRVLGALKAALADATRKSREAHDKYDGQWHGRDPCNTPDAKKNAIEECITIINQLPEEKS